MALFWKEKLLLAKIEAVYGTDPVPTGAANAILAKEVRLTPMAGQDVSRELERPYFGAQPTIPVELHRVLTFKVELAGAGAAGTPPAYGPLLRACGLAETVSAGVEVGYTPITTGAESVTLYFYVGGTRFKLQGARGTFTIDYAASGLPEMQFEFRGLFSPAADQAAPVANFAAFVAPVEVSTANTTFNLNGSLPVMRSFSMDIGNAIEGRFLVGAESILITDRMPSIATTIEATPLATFDPFDTAASAATNLIMSITHGTVAGNIVDLQFLAVQLQRPESIEQTQNIVEWPLRFVPLPSSGNDDFILSIR